MTATPTEREAESTWARLRRRKVAQWGAAYIAGAWALLQGIDFFADAFHWPDATTQIATIALAIGLPVALVLAWYHGERGQQHVGGTELTILAAVLALGGFLLWRYEPATETPATATATAPAPARDPPNSKSIAVLPFVNMSSDKDQEYFADGVSEELLNLLAQVPELRVIARTSSFSFKGKDVDVAEIARRLNVANVLEGSVRRSREKLRITAQLVRASDSSHLWSQTFDREITDVFQVQDEIAATVVEQLKVELLGPAPKVRVTDPRAYALFLQARDISRQYNPVAFEQAIALHRQALAIDSAYAPAWDGLADVYFGQIDLGVLAVDQGRPQVREAINNALTHDPAYAPAYGKAALLEGLLELDFAAAARHLAQGLALDPSNLDLLIAAAAIARRLDRMDRAIQLGEYIVARDPVNVGGYDHLGLAYRYSGQLDKAVDAYRTVLTLAPDTGWDHAALGFVMLDKGDAGAALAEFQQEPVEEYRLAGLSMANHALRRKAESDAALDELTSKYAATRAYYVASVLAFRGETDRAFLMLEEAIRQRDLDIGALPVVPSFVSLHSDPRWLPLLRRLGIAPEQLAAIKFDVKVPR